MRSLHAGYLVDTGQAADCATPTDFAAGNDFTLAYESPEVRIWRLTDPASSP